ncbi:MAG: cell division protein FtsZ [Alphaproteobacteria bacterium]|nr:cell division protein FtsZ [Alphaproteobacteria bacterium]
MVSSEFLDSNENSLSIGLVTPPPEVLLTPNIGVIGVGGAGGNAVNNMVASELSGVSFFVANTDAQALSRSLVSERIQLGVALTQGLGAGANPEVGRAAAEETVERISECLKGLHLLFITAGMGGGTGTGAAPVIARIAKEMGILTVGVVSKPFQFEGNKRMRTANNGLAELKKYVDTLLVIPNQNLFRVVSNSTTFADAFKTADGVLCQGVRSITDLIIRPGMINLDFADVKTVLSSMGRAMMGTGEATGENRAEVAVEKAISNPLLDDSSIRGAKSVLLNISGGLDLTLAEVDLAAERIREELGEEDANIIFGTCADEALHGMIRISIVATGIDELTTQEQSVQTNTSPVQEQIVAVPVDETAGQNLKQSFDSKPEQLSLINDSEELPEEEQFESAVRAAVGDEAYKGVELAVELSEKPTSEQPLLINDEVPNIKPAVQIPLKTDIQPPINVESKKADANVKHVKSGWIDTLFNSGKKNKMQGAMAASSIMPSNGHIGDDQNADNPFDTDDLPAFLRRG